MAQCDGGYFCYACGEYVENITVSELYLRYVLGEVPHDRLLELPDGHIRCNPNLAQYIVDDRFEPIEVDEPALRKENRDVVWVKREEERVSRAWRHLQTLPGSGIPVEQYPLDRPEGSSSPASDASFEDAPASRETDSGDDRSLWV